MSASNKPIKLIKPKFIIKPKSKTIKEQILIEIEQTFQQLYTKFGEPPVHSLSDIKTEDCQHDLEKYGLYLVQGLTSLELYEFNLTILAQELYKIIFDTEQVTYNHPDFLAVLKTIRKRYPHFMPAEENLATLCCFWNSSHGFGNSSFRFIYMMFVEKNPQFKIGLEDIEMNYNPIHRHNLDLLASFPPLWNLLKNMYPQSQPMVSFDSQKCRFIDAGRMKTPLSKVSKPSPSTMTTRHHDIYKYNDIEIDRLQAMIIMQDPQAVMLGFVLFSNHPQIRALLHQYFGKTTDNFGTVSDELLNPILDKYWRAPQEGFVIWNQPTIHYEGVVAESDDFLKTYVSDKPEPINLRSFSFRAVIGTHTPRNLSQQDLKQLAFLSEHGWQHEIYTKNKKHNKGTHVAANIVNTKSTQYNVPRQFTTMELNLLAEVKAKYNEEEINNFVAQMSPIKREMYGIYTN